MTTSDAELESVSCNLCGSTESRVLFDRPYASERHGDLGALAATTDQFRDYGRIVSCSRCSLVFTNPRPRPAALLQGYGDCEDLTYLEEGSSRSINAHLSLNTIKRHARSGKLLEVGSSTGYFLNAARVDFEVTGLEPSSWACGIARERFKLDVQCGSLDSTSLPAEAFDVVAMIDVIEHLGNPRAAVRRAKSLLKDGGILYLMTPDIGGLSARLLGGSWWGLRPAHIYYFDRATLRRLLEEEGFEIVREKSFGRIFSWGYWASRLRGYPRPIYGLVTRLIGAFDVADKFLYLDTRDSMELCARKR